MQANCNCVTDGKPVTVSFDLAEYPHRDGTGVDFRVVSGPQFSLPENCAGLGAAWFECVDAVLSCYVGKDSTGGYCVLLLDSYGRPWDVVPLDVMEKTSAVGAFWGCLAAVLNAALGDSSELLGRHMAGWMAASDAILLHVDVDSTLGGVGNPHVTWRDILTVQLSWADCEGC